jgi:chemotaxis protein MotA
MGQREANHRIGRRRPDLLALLGLAIGIGGILMGLLLEGGRISDVAQVTAALIVFGGTLGATMLTTPPAMLRSAVKRLRTVFVEVDTDLDEIIELIVSLSAKARRAGLVALEQEIEQIRHPFLNRALMLAVDGTPPGDLREMMELEMKLDVNAAEMDAKVFEAAGGYAPTIGILGAVIGLIQVMKHLDNLSAVGYGIAVAFVATIYGVGSANLILLPLGQKVRLRAWQAVKAKQLMLEGVLSISEGTNPRLIRRKLAAFQCEGDLNKRMEPTLELIRRKAASA